MLATVIALALLGQAPAESPAAFLARVNADRAARGVAPLAWDASLVPLAAANNAICDAQPAWVRLPDGSVTPQMVRHQVNARGQVRCDAHYYSDAFLIWMRWGGGMHRVAMLDPRYSRFGMAISPSGVTGQLR